MIPTRPIPSARALRIILLSHVFILLFIKAESQTVLFTEGFETAWPPTGWTLQNYTANSNGWGQYSWDKHTGNYSAACFPNQTNGNSWLFTKALNLQAGKYYVLSYYYKIESGASFKITMGSNPDLLSQPKIIHNNFPSSGLYALMNDTIVCEQTGTYYIGFNNYSATNVSCGILIDDLTFTDMNYPNCNTVQAGTISSTVNTICANTPFNITNSNATVNNFGIRYSWQRSPDGVNWTDITNGYQYQPTIQVSQAAATYYRLTDTCIASGISGVSNQILINNSSYLTCYCTPPFVNCFYSISFTNVSILGSAINNTSTCSPNGYGDFTSIGNAAVYRNQNIYIQHTITNNPYNYAYTIGVWADVNHNGVFEDTEFSMNGPFTGTSAVSQFLVPANALTGETRLRLKIRSYANITGTEACSSNPQSGETEDYKITIGDASNCTGAVSAGTISSSAAQTCPNNPFNITATNTTIYQGQMKYAWQRSADNINWVNLNNTSYLINPLALSENTTAYYRLTDTCLASGQTAVSNSITVTAGNIFNCYCVPQTSNCSSFGIDSVSFNTIHNASGCSAGGYANYTATINTTVNNGTNVPIYLKLKPASGNTKYAGVWIDFNRNGIFETSERVFTGVSTTDMSGNINIPFNVNSGETLMRVAVSNASIFSACSSLYQGETEDYRIILNVASPVTSKFCYYVKQAASGLNNGTNWANAFTTLSTPFSYLTTGDTLKVAKGMYTPGNITTASFQLKDSVVILGGYPDTGNPTDADRNFSSYQSIMSGEIGSPTLNTDNIKIILQGYNVKGFVVDGFIIENGYSTYNAGEYGPVYADGAVGTIKNTVIRKNYNYNYGSGINALNSKLTLLNNFFEGNVNGSPYTSSASSLLYIFSKSDITVINSVIAKNKTGFLFNQSNSAVKLLNSTVFKNYGYSTIHDTSSLVIQNSIFYSNGNNYTFDTAEFKKDIYSSIAVSSSITEVYNSSGTNYLGRNPKFTDTARIAGADDKYYSNDDGLRLINPCSPAINAGNNSFVTTIPADITGATRIKNGIVDLGAYEVQEAIAAQPSVLYVNKNATGLNNGTSWQNAFTDLQTAFQYCSDTIKVAKGVYPVSLSDPDASYRMENNRVIMGGYPNTGSPTNADINIVLNPTQLDGKISSTLKCHNVITSVNNDSTSRMIGIEVINSAAPIAFYPSDYATIKISHKSSPYFENIMLNSLTNQAACIIEVTDQSKPKFYQCTIYNGFNRQSPDEGDRSVLVSKSSTPSFIRTYIGKDTTAATTTDFGAALYYLEGSGGLVDSCFFFRAVHNAVQTYNSSPTIQNTVFTKGYGRSIMNTTSSPLVINCVFNDTAHSYTDYNGGAIANLANSNATYIKCRFYNSYTYRYGGACTNEYSNALFKNCVFKNCRGGFDAGTMYSRNARVKLINCISYYSGATLNVSYAQGDFLHSEEGSFTSIINSTLLTNTTTTNSIISTAASDSLQLYNSILWRYGFNAQITNISNDVTTANNNNTAICDIRNSILFHQQSTAMTSSTSGIDPRLLDLSIIEGSDNLVYTGDDGLKPCTCSPAINAGNNSLNPETTDITDLSRVYNGTIDIGAYEVQANPTTNKTFFVKENAAPAGDGLGWSTAYNNLQKAVLNNCADTIKIAKGTYKPAIQNRDSTFNIYKGTVMLGGYPDNGDPGDAQRNVITNPTVLSGDIGVANDSTDNSYTVMQVHCPDTTVLLDGLTIERANFNKATSYIAGGGALQLTGNKRININNCILQKNYAKYGGGFYSLWSNLTVSKTVIRDNHSPDGDGAGFYLQDYYAPLNNSPWAPIFNFKNSVLCNNKGGAGTISGTGVILYQNNNHFENVVVYKNESSICAGVYITDNAYVTFTNCIFSKNNKTYPGPGISILCNSPYYTLTLNTGVFNSIFEGNTVIGMVSSYLNSEFEWQDGNTQQATIPAQNLTYSAVPSNQSGSSSSGNIGGVSLIDDNNGAGPDNIWMTPDDGLQATPCSNGVDKGNNFYVQNIPLDILDSARIKNVKVDMGPYELGSYTPITPTVTITASDTLVCTGSAVNFYATATAANGNSVYQWKLNGANVGTNSYMYIANNIPNGAVVNVVVTINNPCVNPQTVISNSITVHTSSALTPSVSITSSANPGCAGSGISFSAVPVNGGITPSFQWKLNGNNVGTNSYVYYSTTLSNNDVIAVTMTSSLTCATGGPVTSNSITQIISTPLQPAVTVSSGGIGCPGSSVTVTANPVNGGSAPSFQWKINGVNAGTNSSTFTSSSLNENDIITVVLTSNAPCKTTATATSAPLVIHFTGVVTPSVSITATATNICTGSAVTFTATPVNGGASPSYQWQVNGSNAGTNSSTFTTSSLTNNNQVKVILTSNAACVSTSTATSNIITIIVGQPVTPAITISGNTTVSNGQNTLITASVANAGTSPAYQWQDSTQTHSWLNILNAQGNTLNYTVANTGDKLRCQLTSNGICVTTNNAVSNVLLFTVTGFAGNGYMLNLHPNPVVSTFTIDTLRLSNHWSTLEIINAEGKLMIPQISIVNKTSVQLNVAYFAKGSYFAILRKEDGEMVYIKFIKG